MPETDIRTSPQEVVSRPPEIQHPEGTVTHLVAGILDDAQKLVRQQVEMFKAEVHEDFHQSRQAAEFGGIGVALLTVGFLCLVAALALFLNEQFQLSLWVSFVITGGFFLIVGIALAAVSYRILERVSPLPNKSIHALEETLQWKIK